MATDIKKYLNSDYICSGNKFRKKPVIWVYVENDIDKVFWDTFLHPFEVQQNCQFRISTIRDRNKIQTGKLSILTYLEVSNSERCKLGKYLWACIDSDYDEIVKNFSAFSRAIIDNKYIITTKWYSIENLKCYPVLLRDDLIKISLIDRCDVDFDGILSNISKLYEEMFLLLLEMEEKHDNRFRIEDFCKCLSSISFKDDGLDVHAIKKEIDNWKNAHIDWFNQYSNKFHSWKGKLKALGFLEADYYQLYKGHGVFDKIAVPMIDFFAKKYRSEQINKIVTGADSKDRKEQLVSEYYNATFTSKEQNSLRSRIIQLITDNTPDYNCSASVKIREQIENALA